jgi:hypothetical protein
VAAYLSADASLLVVMYFTLAARFCGRLEAKTGG